MTAAFSNFRICDQVQNGIYRTHVFSGNSGSNSSAFHYPYISPRIHQFRILAQSGRSNGESPSFSFSNVIVTSSESGSLRAETDLPQDPDARENSPPSDSWNQQKELQEEKASRRKSERRAYLIAAIVSSVGITSLAAGAVIYRFVHQLQGSGEIPYLEIFGTFSLAVGAAIGMEFWARWAHRALWHDSLWHMHESHHRPREGPFELNDIFAIINAGPAILLLAYGFFNPGLIPGLCFGAGLGVTVFGMAYMFVHDGLVHRRFPVGPIGEVPYLQEIAAAHQLHHADKYQGVPYGLFLGPQELEEVGGLADLREVLETRRRLAKEAASS